MVKYRHREAKVKIGNLGRVNGTLMKGKVIYYERKR